MKQKGALAIMLGLTMSVTFVPAPAWGQEAVGEWFGRLEVAPGNRLPLLVHIARDEAGTLSGTLDSPAQGVSGLALESVVAEGASLAFEVPSIGGSFVGQWDEGTAQWRGEWKQSGMSWPLMLAVPQPQ